MITHFKGKKISGMLTVLPENEHYFKDEVDNYTFPAQQTLRLQKIMGYEKHRIAKDSTSTSDLCVFGVKHLIDEGKIDVSAFGAIITVTLTPDHFVPHVSNIVQAECGFGHDVICMDVLQGCCAFELGLLQAFLLLEHIEKKVLVLAADVLSHKVSKQDRNSYPLIGDAAAVTVVENDENAGEVWFNLRMDGTRRNVLEIPAGGSRMPCTLETAKIEDDGEGNLRSKNNLRMDGTAVFQFVQKDVPNLILETLELSGWLKEDIDWFLFHQPNRFMLRKLAEKIGAPYEKVPMNIVENYGNPSGASIPMVISHNLAREMVAGKYRCVLSAFGSGLAWCAMTMELGNLDFCDIVVSDL
jgi:3-oxoacyl-[acyl-carrier-protein] synthase-3